MWTDSVVTAEVGGVRTSARIIRLGRKARERRHLGRRFLSGLDHRFCFDKGTGQTNYGSSTAMLIKEMNMIRRSTYVQK